MPPTQELRAFLADLERECPEQVLRIDRPVDPVYEATAVAFEAERLPYCPLVRFAKVGDSPFPLVVNVLATKGRLARGLDVDERALPTAYGERTTRLIEPRRCPDAPFEANVLQGDDLDLRLLPALTHFEQDGGP